MKSELLKVPFQSVEQILVLKRVLELEYGCKIRPRGRHSDRKRVLGMRWRKWSQNDIPWREAEQVAFYKRND